MARGVYKQLDWIHPDFGKLEHVGSSFRYDSMRGSARGPVLDIGEQIGAGWGEERIWQAENGKRFRQEFAAVPAVLHPMSSA